VSCRSLRRVVLGAQQIKLRRQRDMAESRAFWDAAATNSHAASSLLHSSRERTRADRRSVPPTRRACECGH